MDEKGIKPEDMRTAGDLQKIPITKKKDLSEAQKVRPPFGGFLTVPSSDLVRIHQSPGPIYDPVGRVSDYWRWKSALYSVGFRPGDLVVNTFAYHLTPAGHMFEEGVSELGGTIIPTGVGNTRLRSDHEASLGVTGDIGMPGLARPSSRPTVCERQKNCSAGRDPPARRSAILRKRLVEDYHLIGRQVYGTADVGCVSYECPQVNGMHIHHDVIVEICYSNTGQVLPDGEAGEVVVTCNNKIYPLVRFGTGDLSSIVDDVCPCGRTGPRLTRIMGRADQLTKVKGMFVHPSQVQKVMDSHPEIAEQGSWLSARRIRTS